MSNIKELKFDDKNFNRHTSYGMSLLEKSLRENGAGRSILIDKDNNIIAGNGVVESAGQIGLEKVKIVETDGTEIIAVKRTDVRLNSKKGREMALADNATASVDLEWDEENLKSEFDEEELKGWGVDLDWQEETEVTEDEAPEVDESEPANSELGKVYQLGEHRLMCGDSTDAGSVAILMDGQKADMVFTDPPYGVNYEGGHNIKKREKLINDDSDRIYAKVVPVISQFCNGPCYTWFSDSKILNLYKAVQEFGEVHALIIWNKINATYAAMNAQYKQHHEPCLYWKPKGTKLRWCGPTNECTVWEIKRDSVNNFHPTQKPIALAERAIKNHDTKTVLDLFGGSGSTLIACEQLGRKCYMMELDPKYCDVIRKRYWKFVTGSEEGWQDGTRAV